MITGGAASRSGERAEGGGSNVGRKEMTVQKGPDLENHK